MASTSASTGRGASPPLPPPIPSTRGAGEATPPRHLAPPCGSPPVHASLGACVVLVATGSFNPPTYMHLYMFGNAERLSTQLTVLLRIRSSLCKAGLVDQDSLKVMLLCGSDLLESFSTPGVWIPDQGLYTKAPVNKISYL